MKYRMTELQIEEYRNFYKSVCGDLEEARIMGDMQAVGVLHNLAGTVEDTLTFEFRRRGHE